ncbi:MAG: phosphoglucosamine mutase [bacterium]
MTLKISISGVRGHVPESLTPELCLNFAKAFGSYLAKQTTEPRTVVVGTDPRASSEFIKGIVFQGLLSTGCKVVDLGICPTPTVGIMVRQLKATGGIIITASHNPLPWNGLKFVRSDGIFLNENQAEEFLTIYRQNEFITRETGQVVINSRALDIHLAKVLKLVKTRLIKRKRLKVALDCCNGAGSEICPMLLKMLGCQVIAINCDITKPFPHNPEPIAENLGELIELIKNKKADIGFALDSDADRLAIVAETGQPIGEELTLALATKFILQQNHIKNPGKKIVITNLSTTQALDDIVNSFQGTIIRTKIGEVHVAEELKKLDGLIGGEGNGGVIYPKIGFNRDAMVGMALILNFLAVSKKKTSELAGEIPAYFVVKKKIDCDNRDQLDDFIESVKTQFKGHDFITTDGLKVMLPDGWLHVRASNTEPIIRIIAEGKDRLQIEKLVEQVLTHPRLS